MAAKKYTQHKLDNEILFYVALNHIYNHCPGIYFIYGGETKTT